MSEPVLPVLWERMALYEGCNTAWIAMLHGHACLRTSAPNMLMCQAGNMCRCVYERPRMDVSNLVQTPYVEDVSEP